MRQDDNGASCNSPIGPCPANRHRSARVLFGASLFLALTLAGCGAAAEPTATETGPDDEPAEQLSYRFGAKFEPPDGRVVHAMGQWKEYNQKYTGLLGPDLQPVSELIFLDIGDTPRGWDPAQITALVQSVDAAGRIPHIDIALRGLQPSPDSLAKLPDPYYGIDHLIAIGTVYDGRIQDLIAIVKNYGKPVMMRIGGEFNGPWNGYHPYEYPKAFRKIVGMFRAAGADNVAFIWCYEPAAQGDFADRKAQGEYKWYPGADVIDWYSLDLFAAADVSNAYVDPRGDPPYERVIAFLDMAVADGKPVIISESSPTQYDFSDPSEAGAAWSEWFQPYFALIAARPEIKWFHYINYDWTKVGHYANLGWSNNDLTSSAALAGQYVAEVSAPKYLHADEKTLLNGYGDFD